MSPDSLAGKVLGDTYEVEARLGAGGMGAVYSARHLRTGRRYAVKVLHPDRAPSPQAVQRFRREARALAALGHAGIVSIHDFAETDEGLPYMVMDLLEGEDLEQRLSRVGRLRWDDAVTVFEQVASALSAAHREGIIHRDLKPGNIFLKRLEGAPEQATILDFGLAKMWEPEEEALTTTGVGMGTPLYMSPEQAAGQPLDARTDIYSLGAILFEMLAGEPPFTGANAMAVLSKVMSEPPPTISGRSTEPLPRGIDGLIARALAKAPDDRPQDVATFVHEVRALSQGDLSLDETAALAGAPRAATGEDRSASETALAATAPSWTPPPANGEPSGGLSVSGGQPSPLRASPSGTSVSGAAPAQRTSPAVPILVATLLLMAGAIGYLLASRDNAGRDDARSAAREQREPSPEPAPAPAPVAPPAPSQTEHDASAAAIVSAARAAPDAGADLAGRSVNPREQPPPTNAEKAVAARRNRATNNAPEAPAPEPAPAAAPVAPSVEAAPSAAPAAGGGSRYAQMADEIDAFLPIIRQARTQVAGLAQGRAPAFCTNGLAAKLVPLGRSPNAEVGAAARGLRDQIARVCRSFGGAAAVTPELRRRLDDLDPTLDRAERMARDRTISTNRPEAIAQQVITEIERARRETRGVAGGGRPFPCGAAVWSRLRTLMNAGNTWAGAAAGRVVRLRDGICQRMGATQRQRQQDEAGFRRFLDTTEGRLRSSARTFRNTAEALR